MWCKWKLVNTFFLFILFLSGPVTSIYYSLKNQFGNALWTHMLHESGSLKNKSAFKRIRTRPSLSPRSFFHKKIELKLKLCFLTRTKLNKWQHLRTTSTLTYVGDCNNYWVHILKEPNWNKPIIYRTKLTQKTLQHKLRSTSMTKYNHNYHGDWGYWFVSG